MFKRTVILTLLLLASASSAALADFTIPVDQAPGDCHINGTFTIKSDGKWSWSGDAYSSDTGDEVTVRVTFFDKAGNRLTSFATHFDISVSGSWRHWEDSGTFGGYNRIASYRVTSEG